MSRPNIPGKYLRARVIGPVNGERASDRIGPDCDLNRRGGQLETGNPRSPIKRTGRRIIFLGEPESRIINRVDGQGTVIAPAITRAGLATRSGKDRSFAL